MDMAEYMRRRREERKQLAWEYLGSECVKCGSVEKLEFDHIDATTKSFTITSAKALDGPFERLKQELDKCQVLCHRCHRQKTIANGETGGGHNKLPRIHGTAVTYDDGCRCDACKRWKRLYRNRQVNAKGNIRT